MITSTNVMVPTMRLIHILRQGHIDRFSAESMYLAPTTFLRTLVVGVAVVANFA